MFIIQRQSLEGKHFKAKPTDNRFKIYVEGGNHTTGVATVVTLITHNITYIYVILQRKSLEGKLLEARQQLTEVKSTWSEKITQLEHQISHLNAKMVEDSEELENSEKSAQKMKENFQKQVREHVPFSP